MLQFTHTVYKVKQLTLYNDYSTSTTVRVFVQQPDDRSKMMLPTDVAVTERLHTAAHRRQKE